ncbi:transposase [Accumulibacter sp.]|uniref:transposase n=1 Tax=Accumulibacter sp. TaxID=2053492 RepID=UPI002605599C|nr:transposase [Accumulibacter sp.]
MANAARQYPYGLFQSSRGNMGCMAETAAESGYPQLHHMLSESNRGRRGVRRQLVADANVHFGYASGLLIAEGGLAKKAELSAGVARQWNGRLGKSDNCQVEVRYSPIASPSGSGYRTTSPLRRIAGTS